jgi:hypothetical protein
MKITAAQVRDRFTYDPSEGLLRYKRAAGQGGRYPAGTVAGGITGEGYRYVYVGKHQYRASIVIWLWMTGKLPTRGIDHKDTNPGNDKWANLRQASLGEQKRNCNRSKNNKSGFKWVYFDRETGLYRAAISLDKKRINVGRFRTATEAYEAALAVARAQHGDFFNDGRSLSKLKSARYRNKADGSE